MYCYQHVYKYTTAANRRWQGMLTRVLFRKPGRRGRRIKCDWTQIFSSAYECLWVAWSHWRRWKCSLRRQKNVQVLKRACKCTNQSEAPTWLTVNNGHMQWQLNLSRESAHLGERANINACLQRANGRRKFNGQNFVQSSVFVLHLVVFKKELVTVGHGKKNKNLFYLFLIWLRMWKKSVFFYLNYFSFCSASLLDAWFKVNGRNLI